MRLSTSYTRQFIMYAIAGLFLLGAHPAALAQGKPRKAQDSAGKGSGQEQQPKSDKLDISDLEQKYWSPKDTDFGVVQNRTYTKEKRFSLSVLYGPIMNDVFNTGNNLGIIGNYYFSERHGVEVFYIDSDLKDSDAVSDFRKLSLGGTKPDFGRVQNYYGVGYNFVPIYAKMSLLGRKIIYFDMAITPGIGMTTYEKQSDCTPKCSEEETVFSYSLDITQYFFFSRRWAVRFDWRSRWFTEEVIGYTNGQKVRDKTNNTTNLLMGLSFFF